MEQFDNFIQHLTVLTNDNKIIWTFMNAKTDNYYECTYDNHIIKFDTFAGIGILKIDDCDSRCTIPEEITSPLYKAISNQINNRAKENVLKQINFNVTTKETIFTQILDKLYLLTTNNRIVWKSILNDNRNIFTTNLDNIEISINRYFTNQGSTVYKVKMTGVSTYSFEKSQHIPCPFYNEIKKIEKLITLIKNINSDTIPEYTINNYLKTLLKAIDK